MDRKTKIVGIVVWRGGKWYVRRRAHEHRRKLVLAGLASVVVLVLAGILASRGQRSAPAAPER
jgi:hypothetical protein